MISSYTTIYSDLLLLFICHIYVYSCILLSSYQIVHFYIYKSQRKSSILFLVIMIIAVLQSLIWAVWDIDHDLKSFTEARVFSVCSVDKIITPHV